MNIKEIAAASSEQTTGLEQINIAVSEIDGMTQRNAALVQQSTATSNSLLTRANELSHMVEYFKLDESFVKPNTYHENHKAGANLKVEGISQEMIESVFESTPSPQKTHTDLKPLSENFPKRVLNVIEKSDDEPNQVLGNNINLTSGEDWSEF